MTTELERTSDRIKRAERLLRAMRGMSLEERGVFYVIASAGPMLDDDEARAAELDCSLNDYTRIKAALIARGALVVSSGTIAATLRATDV